MLRTIFLLLAASAAFGADLIVVNASVITVDKARPAAQAFAIDNGRFTAVGSNATRIIDLKGMTVTPGFNDAHLHPTAVFGEDSPYYTPWLGPENVKNMDELIAVLKRKADRTPKGQMVSGSRYQDTKLGRHPTRHDLDKVSTEHPILRDTSSWSIPTCWIGRESPGRQRTPRAAPSTAIRTERPTA